MRDYLYIWHDTEKNRVVASGIEFKDFMPCFNLKGGIILLEHQSDSAELDDSCGFSYLPTKEIPELIKEDTYSWGNFSWADYNIESLHAITDKAIAELLFFAHKARPLSNPSIPSLGNNFLAYVHDDGWYMHLYYKDWYQIENFINSSIPASLGSLNATELKTGAHAYWLQAGETSIEIKTDGIDSILNRRL